MVNTPSTVEAGIGRFENHRRMSPVFSICIPQHNRTSFILKCLESFQQQTFQNIEICISDGGSNDGRYEEIVDFLFNSKLSFSFVRHERNLQYDANLRASIALARGRYCFLCGNDDMLSWCSALESLQKRLETYGFPELIITNYREL